MFERDGVWLSPTRALDARLWSMYLDAVQLSHDARLRVRDRRVALAWAHAMRLVLEACFPAPPAREESAA